MSPTAGPLSRLPRTGWRGRLLSWTLRLVQIGIGALGAVLVFNFLIMPRFVHHGEETTVPDVEGRTLENAVSLLASFELGVRDTVTRTNPTVPAGLVVEQLPRPGMTVKANRSVILTVSGGKSLTRVPELAGNGLRFARVILGQEGYVLGAVLREWSSHERNQVVASDPPAGTVLPPGEEVSVLVSDGLEPETWIMPDFRGKRLRSTADRLRFAGFPVRIREPEEGFGIDRIRTTRPLPGSQVAAGDTIRLIGE